MVRRRQTRGRRQTRRRSVRRRRTQRQRGGGVLELAAKYGNLSRAAKNRVVERGANSWNGDTREEPKKGENSW